MNNRRQLKPWEKYARIIIAFLKTSINLWTQFYKNKKKYTVWKKLTLFKNKLNKTLN